MPTPVAGREVAGVGLGLVTELGAEVVLSDEAPTVARLDHAPLHDLGERGGQHVADAAAQVLLDGVAADLGHGVVDAHVAQVVVDEREADRRGRVQRVDERAHLVARGQRRALGADVARHPDERARPPVLVVHPAPGALEPVHGAVGPHRAEARLVGLARLERVAHRGLHALAVLRVDQRVEVLERRRRLLRLQPEQRRERRRPAQLARVEVDAERAGPRSVQGEQQLVIADANDRLRAGGRGEWSARGRPPRRGSAYRCLWRHALATGERSAQSGRWIRSPPWGCRRAPPPRR